MACYRERCTAEGAGDAERECDGWSSIQKGPQRIRGSEDVRISLKGWVGHCMMGHIEGVMALVAQTGAMVTATD